MKGPFVRTLALLLALTLTAALVFAACNGDDDDEVDGPPGGAINIVTFDTHPLAVLDLRTGGADAVLGDFPVVLLDADESDGELEVVDFQVDPEPYGIGVRHESPELKAALEEAMESLRASGRYDEILQEWDLESARLEVDDDGEAVESIDVSGVPELQDGVLTVGSDIAYAPMEFFQPGTDTPDGFSIDLANAIAELFGVEVQFINSDFDGLILSLTTGEFDVIISSMTITEDRLQQIDFVPYADVGTGILVQSGNPEGIQDLDGLCGLTVAVQVGTIQVDMLDEQNQVCQS